MAHRRLWRLEETVYVGTANGAIHYPLYLK